MLNIDFGVEALSPQLTGIGRYSLELLQGLRSQPAIGHLRTFYQGSAINNADLLLAGRRPHNGRLARAWQSFISDVRKVGPQTRRLYHGPNFMLPTGTTGIITVHDLSVYRYPEMHPPERIAHFAKDFARSLDQALHIITDTEQVRQEVITFSSFDPSRVTAVHLGVSETYRPDRGENGSSALRQYGMDRHGYMLLVATFEPRKRIDAALRAFHLLPERLKERYPLVLVGAAGWQNDELHDMMARDEAKGLVRFLGFVPEEHLPGVYAGARLFLYPSIYEGFGLPPIEAMASGVPVIVSNRSCLPEVTKGAAMMIDPDDVESFAAAIMRGLEDDAWRTEAIRSGLEVASGYSWRTCVDNTVNVYRQVWAES